MRRSYTDVLSSSQQAACFLETRGSLDTSMPIPFISSAESSEMWTKYESLMLACLETGDDKAAHQCLEKLIHRFGASNERLMGLRGIYQEAVAENRITLENILKEYDDIRANNPVNAVKLYSSQFFDSLAKIF